MNQLDDIGADDGRVPRHAPTIGGQVPME